MSCEEPTLVPLDGRVAEANQLEEMDMSYLRKVGRPTTFTEQPTPVDNYAARKFATKLENEFFIFDGKVSAIHPSYLTVDRVLITAQHRINTAFLAVRGHLANAYRLAGRLYTALRNERPR